MQVSGAPGTGRSGTLVKRTASESGWTICACTTPSVASGGGASSKGSRRAQVALCTKPRTSPCSSRSTAAGPTSEPSQTAQVLMGPLRDSRRRVLLRADPGEGSLHGLRSVTPPVPLIAPPMRAVGDTTAGPLLARDGPCGVAVDDRQTFTATGGAGRAGGLGSVHPRSVHPRAGCAPESVRPRAGPPGSAAGRPLGPARRRRWRRTGRPWRASASPAAA